jgi:hypothetical protein
MKRTLSNFPNFVLAAALVVAATGARAQDAQTPPDDAAKALIVEIARSLHLIDNAVAPKTTRCLLGGGPGDTTQPIEVDCPVFDLFPIVDDRFICDPLPDVPAA